MTPISIQSRNYLNLGRDREGGANSNKGEEGDDPPRIRKRKTGRGKIPYTACIQKKRYDSRMNEFGIVSKRPSIQDAIRCDRRILGIGAQHGKNIDSCRYQSVRVVPV